MKADRIRELHEQMDSMLENPNGATIADFAELQRELSNLLYKKEADENLHSQRQEKKAKRNAMAMLVTEP